jgi:formylglycine-generating enzyme required for sulfatase activity
LPDEKKLGRVYRLPTEQEWEYACRAGTSTPYYFGKSISPAQANFGDMERTMPVGHYNNPNRFGLYDMHGNLWEFCDGWYSPYREQLRDPNKTYPRVVRGGSWGFPAAACRSASRRQGFAANMYTGFRVAFSVGDRRAP